MRLLWFILLYSSFIYSNIIIETFYGSLAINEPVLIDLIQSQAIQRLKKLNQYGVMHFVRPQLYTRYDHSLGVLFLLRHFNAPLEEQIFGLLHDVSHTAFSHVADYFFDTILNRDSYQDSILEWFVQQTDVIDILQRYGFANVCTEERRKAYTMVKNDLPNVCIDRLEYTLYGAYIEGWLTKQEVHSIIEHLAYIQESWVFDSYKYARSFANASVSLSKNFLCTPWNCFVYKQAALLLKRAFEIDLISKDDLLFSTDEQVWDHLLSTQDDLIKTYFHRIFNYTHSFTMTSAELCDFSIKAKYRGVDPLLKIGQAILRLTEYDAEFKTEYDQAKCLCQSPMYFTYQT